MYLRQMNEEETQILHDVSRDALMEYTRGVSRWVRISSLQEEAGQPEIPARAAGLLRLSYGDA